MKRKYLGFYLVFIFLLQGFGGGTKAENQNKNINITGIYSDMYYNKEGGDVLGSEIFLLYSAKGYFIVYQYSEGEPSVPLITEAKVKDLTIEFTIQGTGNYNGTFKGNITREGLKGKFENGYELNLKRKTSYWQ